MLQLIIFEAHNYNALVVESVYSVLHKHVYLYTDNPTNLAACTYTCNYSSFKLPFSETPLLGDSYNPTV